MYKTNLIFPIVYVILFNSCSSIPFSFPNNGFYNILNPIDGRVAEFIKIPANGHDWLGSDTKIYLRIIYPSGNQLIINRDFSYSGGEYEFFIEEMKWYEENLISFILNTGMTGRIEIFIDLKTLEIREHKF